jgi:beta-1,4-mannosyltransferase
MGRESVAVIVMGDLGRSPRMLNHVDMILKHTPFEVDLIGCPGSQLRSSLHSSPRVRVKTISSSFVDRLKRLPKAFFLVYAAFRILVETLQLLWVFGRMQRPRLALVQVMLTQNPPNLPVLAVLVLVSFFRQFPVCIDWHNYGFSILQVAHRPRWLVETAEAYERFVGGLGDFHLCVSNSLKLDLARHNVKAKTLYDLPTVHFQPIADLTETARLKNLLGVPLSSLLVVSSTSWTPDEDFGLLLEAIDHLDEVTRTEVCFVITGKGPMKDFYAQEIDKRSWKNCSVKLAWLTAEDYPRLLGVADLGVCLHTSSSKLDLPMKVVDMHGAALPVLAYAYPTIGELVTQKTGATFVDSSDLSHKLAEFLSDSERLVRCRQHLVDKRKEGTWETEWNRVVYPLLLSAKVNCE